MCSQVQAFFSPRCTADGVAENHISNPETLNRGPVNVHWISQAFLTHLGYYEPGNQENARHPKGLFLPMPLQRLLQPGQLYHRCFYLLIPFSMAF